MENWHETITYLLAYLFLFCFGATIGSFLNVVIYRLPAGLNLVKPASRCPLCGHPIRMYDNVPVLGWIWLRGRCRDCAAPIPIRYPSVEFTVGLVVLGLGQWELLRSGANLPLGSDLPRWVDPLYWYASWPMTALFVYHCLLLCCYLVALLIRVDGHPLPWRFFRGGLVIGFVFPLFVPVLRAMHWGQPWTDGQPPFGLGLLDGLAGGLSGYVLARIHESRRDTGDRNCFADATVLLTITGLFLGWQVALCVMTVAALVLAILRMVGHTRNWHTAAFIGGAATVHLLFWRELLRIPFWPGGSTAVWPYLLFLATVVLCSRIANKSETSLQEQP